MNKFKSSNLLRFFQYLSSFIYSILFILIIILFIEVKKKDLILYLLNFQMVMVLSQEQMLIFGGRKLVMLKIFI